MSGIKTGFDKFLEEQMRSQEFARNYAAEYRIAALGDFIYRVNYDELDPGIRQVVHLLREKGFDTTDSGDGVSKPAAERLIDRRHVFISTPVASMVEEADRAFDVLRRHGFARAHVEATYSPNDGIAVIMVFPDGE